MTTFYQVKNNAYATASAGLLSNTTTPLTLNGLNTTRFDEITTGYIATIWNATAFADPSDDPNMEIALITAATIGTSGSLTLTRPNPVSHSGTQTIGVLIVDQHLTDLQDAINAAESELALKASTAALTTALTTKSDVGHTHVIAAVSGLQTALDSKADNSSLATVATSGSYNDLIDTPVIPTAPVTSVAGRTGDVVLTKADVGLSNVDNTSDTAKPVSTATQTALNLKADTTALTTHTSNTNNPHSVTKAQVGLSNVDNTSDLAKPISTLTQTALDGKSSTGHTHTLSAVTDVTATATELNYVDGVTAPIQGQIDGKAASIHSHTLSNVSDVTATAAELNYVDGVTSSIQPQLDGKAALVHSHTASQVTDFSTAADARISAAAGVSVASLSGGKVPTSQLPALALTTVQTAASQAAQLALTTQEGDVVVRTDENKTYMRNAGTAGTMADYTLLNTPTDTVTSVNGQTGVVSLGKADVGLGNVDNTSDANKPISTATQTALDNKVTKNADITAGTHTKITFDAKGLITSGTAATQDDIGDGTTYKQYSQTEKTKLAGIATGATANQADAYLLSRANHTGTQPISTVTDLQTTLDGKANSVHTHTEADIVDLGDYATNTALTTGLATKADTTHGHDSLTDGTTTIKIDSTNLGAGVALLKGNVNESGFVAEGGLSFYSRGGTDGLTGNWDNYFILNETGGIIFNIVADTPGDALFSVIATDGLRLKTNGPGAGTLLGDNLTGVRAYQLPDTDGTFAMESYVDTAITPKANDTEVVHLTGTESIAGTKTFTDNVIVEDGNEVRFGNAEAVLKADLNLGNGALFFTGTTPELQRSLHVPGDFSIYSHTGATGGGVSAPELTFYSDNIEMRANGVDPAWVMLNMADGLRIKTNGSYYAGLLGDNLTADRLFQFPNATGTLATESYVDTGLATKAASSHTHTLDGLSDVVITTPVNGHVLKYDSGSSTWINAEDATAVGGGATNLAATLSSTNTIITSDTGTDATIPAVDATNAGVMTPAMKTKLDGIAAGATANSSDATLLARANHTGTQSADTLTDGTTNKAFLATERTKLTGIATGATANSSDAFLLSVDNHTSGVTNKLYTSTEQTKLAGIATGATANDTDANLKARANHTGTQTASTISDFSTAADARITAATGVSVQAYNANTTTLGNTTTGTGSIVRGTSPNITTPTGIVKGDVGLGNVDNTSDASKPVSTLQQTAIDKTKTTTLTITRSGTADYICDGVDDNVQIQAAVDALNAAGGGTLFVRTGTYRITVAVAVPENVTIRGERMARQSTGGVTFKTTAATSLTDMFTVTGTANPASNADLKHDIVFENITFDGNNTTTNNVKLTNQDTVKFIDCRFIQSTNSLVTVWNSTVAPTAATIPGGIYAVRCNFSPAAGGIGVDLQYQTQCWFISCWHTPPSGTPAAHFRIKACNKIDIQGSEFNTATAALKFEDVNLGGAMDYSNYDINVNAKTFANGGTVISSTMSHASSGNIKVRGTMSNGTTIGDKLIGSGNLVELNADFTPFNVLSQAAADKVLILKGFASQSGRYLEVQNSSATAIAYINSGGNWYVNNGSTSAVAYGFTSEINSGLYRIGASNLGISLGGTKYVDLSTTAATFTADVVVPDEVYGVGWNGSLEVPTKNAVYDKIESLTLSGTGDVVGPASSTDNAIVRFDATTGKLVQNSSVTISDTGDVNFNAKAYLTDYGTGRSFSLDAPTGGNYIGMYAEASSVSINAQGALSIYSNSSITLDTGSDDINLTPGSGLAYVNSVPIVTTTDIQTLTNKRITPRASTTTSSATPTINTNTTDVYGLTAQAVDITSFTTNLSGTPTNGQKLWIYIVGTASRAITWGASFENGPATLPTTTSGTNRLDVGFIWNAATSKWRCMAQG